MCVCVCVCVFSHAQLFVTPWTIYSSPGSSVHGILQARILEGIVISFSRGSSWFRDQTQVSWVSCIGRQVLYHCAIWDFPCGSAGKESTCNEGDLGSVPGLGRFPGEGNSYPVFWPGEFHGLYSPQGHKELDMTEWLPLSSGKPGGRIIPIFPGMGWWILGIGPLPTFWPIVVNLGTVMSLVGVAFS